MELTPETGDFKDWNKEFQEAMEILPEDLEGRMRKFETIFKLARNFERTATLYGKIIISGK